MISKHTQATRAHIFLLGANLAAFVMNSFSREPNPTVKVFLKMTISFGHGEKVILTFIKAAFMASLWELAL